MADKVKLWFDSEVDYLEVTFSDAPGYMRPTGSDGVMKRVDEQGHVIGFSVFGVSRFRKDHPLKAEFTGEEHASTPADLTGTRTESSSKDS
jgi:hypothetical protein